MKQAEITLTGPNNARVMLDGQEVRGFRGFTFTAGMGELPWLVLDLPIVEDATLSGEVRVYIQDETRDLLIRLGWTPPSGDTP